MRVRYIHLQQVLETVGAAAPALGDIPEDVDDCGEDVGVAVGQQGWGLDVVHFGDLVVQFDEAGGWLTTGDGDEAFFDNGTVVGLWRPALARTSQEEGDREYLISSCR